MAAHGCPTEPTSSQERARASRSARSRHLRISGPFSLASNASFAGFERLSLLRPIWLASQVSAALTPKLFRAAPANPFVLARAQVTESGEASHNGAASPAASGHARPAHALSSPCRITDGAKAGFVQWDGGQLERGELGPGLLQLQGLQLPGFGDQAWLALGLRLCRSGHGLARPPAGARPLARGPACVDAPGCPMRLHPCALERTPPGPLAPSFSASGPQPRTANLTLSGARLPVARGPKAGGCRPHAGPGPGPFRRRAPPPPPPPTPPTGALLHGGRGRPWRASARELASSQLHRPLPKAGQAAGPRWMHRGAWTPRISSANLQSRQHFSRSAYHVWIASPPTARFPVWPSSEASAHIVVRTHANDERSLAQPRALPNT
ncbi:hypothetical protein BDY21DRAFT_422457 [Lineolata rhizophorae]|uniref:Uncharacterized protein n=1 Tax=Lineolata rhizophorae TaxID=578093 RepID=A0A6A6NXD2_9PEZI|nr:hypothetical protein BDY21DRAFT_422457 [Lineolata rhizophorae]